ncbi:unnamed protein product [Polarella glacialis]|uniref:EF-hand domain-containing protein n=1 Tax=Polarella glacialis TaxID=89957 RepID=A0A813IEW7_POLGL|nr:unnamed protein product [Polarella glacialis]
MEEDLSFSAAHLQITQLGQRFLADINQLHEREMSQLRCEILRLTERQQQQPQHQHPLDEEVHQPVVEHRLLTAAQHWSPPPLEVNGLEEDGPDIVATVTPTSSNFRSARATTNAETVNNFSLSRQLTSASVASRKSRHLGVNEQEIVKVMYSEASSFSGGAEGASSASFSFASMKRSVQTTGNLASCWQRFCRRYLSDGKKMYQTFEVFFCLVIVLNCIALGIEADTDVRDNLTGQLMHTFVVSEFVFTSLFLFELLVRMACLGIKRFFPWDTSNWWNCLDACLVLAAVFFSWIVPLLAMAGFEINKDAARTISALRGVRLLRLVQVVRKVDIFHEVWLLLRGLTDSMRVLFWTIIVIVFITYIFAVFGLVMIAKNISELHHDVQLQANPDLEEKATLEMLSSYLCGLSQMMYTLVQVLTLDSFNAITRPLLVYIPWSWLFWYAYIAIAVFVLMNLVTAIIVENAVSASRNDEERMLSMRAQAKSSELHQLKNLFFLMDSDGDGILSFSEFEAAFNDPTIIQKWRLLDFEPEECKRLFKLLDTGDGNIDTEEFFEGLSRMKGPAQATSGKTWDGELERQTSKNPGSDSWGMDFLSSRRSMGSATFLLSKLNPFRSSEASSLPCPIKVDDVLAVSESEDEASPPPASLSRLISEEAPEEPPTALIPDLGLELRNSHPRLKLDVGFTALLSSNPAQQLRLAAASLMSDCLSEGSSGLLGSPDRGLDLCSCFGWSESPPPSGEPSRAPRALGQALARAGQEHWRRLRLVVFHSTPLTPIWVPVASGGAGHGVPGTAGDRGFPMQAPVPVPAGGPSKSAKVAQEDSQTMVVFATSNFNEIGIRTLVGEYVFKGANHRRPFYQKTQKIPGYEDIDVFLYFWEDNSNPEQSGWWFGNSVGGSQVWSASRQKTMKPPKNGWHIPWDGEERPELCVVGKPEKLAEDKASTTARMEARRRQEDDKHVEVLATEWEDRVLKATERCAEAEIDATEALDAVQAAVDAGLEEDSPEDFQKLVAQQKSLAETQRFLALEVVQAQKAPPALKADLQDLVQRLRDLQVKIKILLQSHKPATMVKAEPADERRAQEEDRGDNELESQHANQLEEMLPAALEKVDAAEDEVEKVAIAAAPLQIECADDLRPVMLQAIKETEQRVRAAQAAIGVLTSVLVNSPFRSRFWRFAAALALWCNFWRRFSAANAVDTSNGFFAACLLGMALFPFGAIGPVALDEFYVRSSLPLSLVSPVPLDRCHGGYVVDTSKRRKIIDAGSTEPADYAPGSHAMAFSAPSMDIDSVPEDVRRQTNGLLVAALTGPNGEEAMAVNMVVQIREDEGILKRFIFNPME